MSERYYRKPALWIAAALAIAGFASFLLWWYAASSRGPTPSLIANTNAIDDDRITDAVGRPFRNPVAAVTRESVGIVSNTSTDPTWEVVQRDPGLLDRTPPQVAVIPAQFSVQDGSWVASQREKRIGINLPTAAMLRYAYGWPQIARIIVPGELRDQRFDYIANLASGSAEALQAEIAKKLGVIVRRESIFTNAFILTVVRPDAPTRSYTNLPARLMTSMTGLPDAPISRLAASIENMIHTPVLDGTGLTGRYDLSYPTPGSTGRSRGGSSPLDQVKRDVLEPFGLDLLPTNSLIEFLVVEKVR